MSDLPTKHASRNERADLIHLLNQRYRQEWERAENLQAELTRIQSWWFWPVIAWLRRLKRRLRPISLPDAVPDFDPAQRLSESSRPVSSKVSIIIPFKDRLELLQNCLRSLRTSTYRRFEIVLVNNGSTQSDTLKYLRRLEVRRGVRVLHCPGAFNFSRLCNEGAAQARGAYLLFLNNDVEVSTPDWLERLLRIAQQPQVGIVGATLLYPNHTLQHTGLFSRENGDWIHVYRGDPADYEGVWDELRAPRAVPAVTGACLLMRRELFAEVGGFDLRFPITFGDVDLCRRVRERGLLVAVTPHARLVHYESLTRGYSVD
jgi:O-antigen biosynthesis protein